MHYNYKINEINKTWDIIKINNIMWPRVSMQALVSIVPRYYYIFRNKNVYQPSNQNSGS